MLAILTLIIALQASPDTLSRLNAALSVESRFSNEGFNKDLIHVLMGELPFWMHANQLGRIDEGSTNLLARLEMDALIVRRDRFRVDGGFDGVLRLSNMPTVFAPEAWVAASYDGFRIDLGRRSLPVGLGYHPLSIGTMMMGTNATPPVGVHVSTPQFLPVPLAQGYLHFNVKFGNSWLTGPRYVRNAMLHRKHLYLRLDLFGFEGFGGIVHNAMWGGTHREIGRLPSTADDFMRVVLGRPGTDPRLGGDVANVIGNNMAAYDFMLQRRMPAWSFSVSRLFYLEDKVSMRFRSPWDGQWGARIFIDPERSPGLHSIVYDHVYTIRQDSRPGEAYGRANYYNHGTYRSGFTSYGRSLGLPLMTTDPRRNNAIDNNMVVAHHVGLAGSPTSTISYTLRTTYSRNYGTRRWGTPGEQIVLPRPERRRDEWSVGIDMVWSPELTRQQYILGYARDLNSGIAGFRVGVRVGSNINESINI